MRPLLCSLAGLLTAAPLLLAAQQAPAPDAAIRAVMDRPEFRHALWGVAFYDLDAKKLLAGVNTDRLFTPGSTTKLLTMGTALEALGPDHRFRTRIYRTGPIKDGVLLGDLVLRASGDPNLSGRVRDGNRYAFVDRDHSYGGMPLDSDPLTTIKALVQQVAKAGIRKISGEVIVDASLFPEGDRELGTRIVLSPMVVNDNVIDIVLRPGTRAGDPVQVEVSPKTSYLTVHATLTTADSGAPVAVRTVEDSTSPDRRVMIATGTIPRGAPVNARWAVASPRRFGEIVLTEALQAAGISAVPRLGARTSDARTFASVYTDSLMVAEHVSLPLTAEAVVLLKTSQNLHASNFPLLLPALTQAPAGRTGFDIARDWLQKEGLDTDGAQQGDGAGGDALFSPMFMVQYLAMIAKKPWAGAFHDALPILGRDGTLALIQVKSPGAGFVHAKTGTYSKYDALNRRALVTGKGLAGYVTTRSGRHLAIALYVNNLAVKQGDPTDVAGQALGEIASLAWERIK
ncbi:MAG: D-alanyl-D-alanine carboxypeptidase/D-alanyl-D-alanine-endopeptidase [Gemmatimonadaceae bacterium]|nr:D-alanyl-D-alanine carboxypeptidase/D-alanyl-D-alanine-endopeptidase [Gemmatimonadaceae bacterium]